MKRKKKDYIDVGKGFDAEHKHRKNIENRKALARMNAIIHEEGDQR